MNRFSTLRQARQGISRLIPVAERYMLSVYNEEDHTWSELGPYDYREANDIRREIFRRRVEQLSVAKTIVRELQD